MKLEYVESLILAHPFVKGFDQVSYCVTEEEVVAVAQGEISDVILSRKKEDMEGKEGVSPVYSTTFYIGLQIEDKPGKILFLQYDYIDPFLRFSWFYWSTTARHIVSHNRVHQACQNVGEIR